MVPAGETHEVPAGTMRIWMMLEGQGELRQGDEVCPFVRGDVVLIPAACAGAQVTPARNAEWIEVTVPVGI